MRSAVQSRSTAPKSASFDRNLLIFTIKINEKKGRIFLKIYELSNLQDDGVSAQILQILTRCNNEFVPPLDTRNSTMQSDFSKLSELDNNIPYAYFELVKEQNALIVGEDGIVAGFISFRKDVVTETIPSEYLPNIYISTVITDTNFRRQGITKRMYEKLFEKYSARNIFTRTWSTNLAHTRLLESYGFAEYKRIENDRGDGIDTVYYLKLNGK